MTQLLVLFYFGTVLYIFAIIKFDYKNAQACDCKLDGLLVRFPLEEIIVFKFFRPGAAAKYGIDFRHSTTNAC